MLINYSRERDEISRPNQVGGEYLHDLWNIQVDKPRWRAHAITHLEAAHTNQGEKDHRAKLLSIEYELGSDTHNYERLEFVN